MFLLNSPTRQRGKNTNTSLACRITMSFEQTYFVLGALEGQSSQDLAKHCKLLENSAEWIKYDRHLRKCHPIASRVIEAVLATRSRNGWSELRQTLEGAPTSAEYSRGRPERSRKPASN